MVTYIIYQIVSYMSSGKAMIAGLIKKTLYKMCHYFPNHIIALVKLKTEVDKIDVDNLKTAPVDLSKLSGAVNNKVEKKNVYDKSITKVNAIDSSGFVLKTKNMIQINQVLKIKSMTQSKKYLLLKYLIKNRL